jgi:hypothetical protein
LKDGRHLVTDKLNGAITKTTQPAGNGHNQGVKAHFCAEQSGHERFSHGHLPTGSSNYLF